MRYAILGTGRQGLASAYDIARFGGADEIILMDNRPDTVSNGVQKLNSLLDTQIVSGKVVDVTSEDNLASEFRDVDAILAAVPYKYLPKLTEIAIQTRTHMVDLGGHTNNARKQIAMSGQAKETGITIVPECGMGPGMNITLAIAAMEQMDSPEHVSIWDGGLPQKPTPPWNYSLFFNINGLTNEYDGSAFFLDQGKITQVPCFERIETLEFPEPIGILEAAVTSGGLSTMPWTFEGKILTLENKTLRYPGHWEWMKGFRQLGLFSENPVPFQGQEITPREFYHQLLEPQLDHGRVEDICLMRVRATGNHQGSPKTVTINSIEYSDQETGFSAMEKWTGWHASIMLIHAAQGKLEKGVIPVENAMKGSTFIAEAKQRKFDIRLETTEG
ncbi:MAG: saccharopine dehydrogenase NADP-binding domain-containing protein [Candidatus Marinimicrobia bacterium]|nr:saccharopine dehydrogenase NADP-binding domain-containing protein [Candidatus Neomarinimicrobiota bacterium]